jgi:inward rectifier potassium channel
MANARPRLVREEDLNRDLGFGAVVASQSRKRLLNRDGSFNVRREGLKALESLSFYHFMLTTSWPHFLGLVALTFVAINCLFALALLACGPGAIAGAGVENSGGSAFLRAFFFSVQTFATIGYGHMSPAGVPANLVVTLESLVGLLLFALATGLLFARFARPTARILYSRTAVIAPYREITAFEFRLLNARSTELIEVGVRVTLARFRDGERAAREFIPLKLERDRVNFLPLSLTVVHAIDKESPLHGFSHEELDACGAEFLVLLTATDEVFAQVVNSRTSYTTQEIAWGARFRNIFKPPTPSGELRIDVTRLHEIEPAPLPS